MSRNHAAPALWLVLLALPAALVLRGGAAAAQGSSPGTQPRCPRARR